MPKPPPDRFGYQVVASAFSVQGLAIGLTLTAYPVLMASIESEFGATRTQASLGIPLLLLATALSSPWIGRRVDTGSARRVMTEGALLVGVGYALLSQTSSLWLATLLWIGLVGVGQSMLGALPAMTVVARWFVVRRARMIAIAAMGTTFGGAIVPPVAEVLVASVGWRGAVLCFGATAVVLGLPLVRFGIIDNPEQEGLHPDGLAAAPEPEVENGRAEGAAAFFAERNFWCLGLGFGLMSGAGIAFLTHAVPFAIERGLDREQAVAVLTLNALSAAAGKLLFGALTDRLGPQRAIATALGLECVGWLAVLSSTGPFQFVGGAALFSLGLGSMIPCQAGFVAHLYGRARFGQASGLVGLVSMLGPLVVPLGVGIGYDALGSYAVPMTGVLGALVIALLLFTAVRLEAVPETAVTAAA